MVVNNNDEAAAHTPANQSAGGDFHAPEWLTAKLFEDALKTHVPNYKRTKSFSAKKPLAAGENYATIMLNLQFDVELESGSTRTVSFIAKVAHPGMDDLLGHDIFGVETAMYKSIVPEMEEMYRQAGVEVKFGAQYYDVTTPPQKKLVCLEDLRLKGFKNVNRLDGLDMQHTKCALKKLAQWHAASAVRVETKGKYDEAMTSGFVSEKNLEMLETINKPMIETFMKCVKKYDNSEIYLADLENYLPKRPKNIHKADPGEFNVLNHGDYWSNNIMFQYDAFGNIKETYLIDYQIPQYGSPAQDLFYFLLSSTQYEIKLKNFEYFIKYYYDHLAESLKLLKYPKKLPKLRDIHTQLYKYGVWGMTTATGIMSIILLEPNEDAQMDQLFGDTAESRELKILMYSNDRYRKHIQAVLPWLQNRGVFDV